MDKGTELDCQGSVRFGGKRCTFAILAFFALFVSFMTYVDLSVAIVAMVRRGEGKILSFLMKMRRNMHCLEIIMSLDINSINANMGIECQFNQSSDLNEEKGGFDWDAQTQGLALSSFSFGYFSTQLVGGILAEKFSGKWILGVCLFICFVLEFVIPFAAKYNVLVLIGVRAIQGRTYHMFRTKTANVYHFKTQSFPEHKECLNECREHYRAPHGQPCFQWLSSGCHCKSRPESSL